jgi:hypothetical protein
MTTAATSSLGKAREHLLAMLAASATFRTWVGATGDDEAALSAAAAKSIWYESLPMPDSGNTYSDAEIDEYWPYALIATEDYAARRVANATYEDGGVFLIQLVGLADDADNDPNETTVLFENIAAKIVEELAALSEQAGYLEISDLRIVGGPVRAQPEDIAAGGRDEMTLNVRVQWGS